MKKLILLSVALVLGSCTATKSARYAIDSDCNRTIYTNSYKVVKDTILTDEVLRGGKTKLVKIPIGCNVKVTEHKKYIK